MPPSLLVLPYLLLALCTTTLLEQKLLLLPCSPSKACPPLKSKVIIQHHSSPLWIVWPLATHPHSLRTLASDSPLFLHFECCHHLGRFSHQLDKPPTLTAQRFLTSWTQIIFPFSPLLPHGSSLDDDITWNWANSETSHCNTTTMTSNFWFSNSLTPFQAHRPSNPLCSWSDPWLALWCPVLPYLVPWCIISSIHLISISQPLSLKLPIPSSILNQLKHSP